MWEQAQPPSPSVVGAVSASSASATVASVTDPSSSASLEEVSVWVAASIRAPPAGFVVVVVGLEHPGADSKSRQTCPSFSTR
jgi:hypothetical protein